MSLQDLKSAALQVKLEESADNLGAFIDAAEEIAQKHGLDSPSKHRVKSKSVSDWIEDVEKSTGRKENNTNATEQAYAAASIDAAANDLVAQAGGRVSPMMDEVVLALAAQMGVDLPETAGPATDDEAVNNLMAPHNDVNFNESVKGRKNKGIKFGNPGAMDTANNRNQTRYLTMRKSMENKETDKGVRASTAGNVVVITRRSRVSKMLDQVDTRSSSAGGRVSSILKDDYQQMMFREMKVIEDNDSVAKKKKHRKIIIKGEEAAKAGTRLSTQLLKSHQEPSAYELLTRSSTKIDIDKREKMYSKFEDAKECTFRPKVRKNGSTETPQDDEVQAKKRDNFVERQEAAERGRVNKIELDIGKARYDALLDKKFCPQCKAKQSYDDIKEKRKRCNNCNVEYTTTIEWNKVKKDFYERQQSMLDGIDKKRQYLAQELEKESRRSTKIFCDKTKGKLVVGDYDVNEINSAKWDEDMEHDFFDRSAKMERKRQIHLKEVENEMYGDVGMRSIAASDIGDDLYGSVSGGSRLFGVDAATAFLHRYEEDVRRRNALKAEQRETERQRKGLMDRTVEDNLCEHLKAFRP